MESKKFKVYYASSLSFKEQELLKDMCQGVEDIYFPYTANSTKILSNRGWEKDSIANKLFKYGANEDEQCLIYIDLG